MLQKTKVEKELLNRLKEDIETGDFKCTLNDYVKLINLNPHQEGYWSDILNLIYNGYKYTGQDEWASFLEKGIEIAEKARQYILSSREQSKYFMYEYYLVIELIRFDSTYTEGFDDEKLMNLIESALISDPQNDSAVHQKGNLYQANGNFEMASIEYEKIAGENDSLLFDRALNYELLNNNDKATDAYLKLYKTSKETFMKRVSLESLIRIYKTEKNKEKINYYQNILNEIL